VTRAALASLVLAACAVPPPSPAPAATTPVQHVGPMREVMHDGRTQPRARLSDHAERGTFAVGALAGLAGEVLIDDGAVWTASGDTTAVRADANAQATLLTSARVAAWRELPLPALADLQALEHALAAAVPGAAALGEAVPFVVEGRGRVALHVVRGACPHGAATADRQPARWSAAGVPVRAVGFFVRGQQGVVTHMGTALHLHAFANDGARRAMGHVDELALTAGAVLRVPAAAR
jgi:hypothetical protein